VLQVLDKQILQGCIPFYSILNLKNWHFLMSDQVESCHMQFTRVIESFHWLVVVQSQEVKQLPICQKLLSSLKTHYLFSFNQETLDLWSQEGQAASHLSEIAVFLGVHHPCFIQLQKTLQTCIYKYIAQLLHVCISNCWQNHKVHWMAFIQ